MVDPDRSFTDLKDKNWLRIAAACSYLGVSRRTLCRWRSEFALPAHAVGRTTYFLKRDLDHFLERHRLRLAMLRAGGRGA